MRLSISFTELTTLVRKMGATAVQWESKAENLGEIDVAEVLLHGLEIDLDELETTEDGLLTYKGEHVLLYIKDTMTSKFINENEPENSRRFHVADCRKLDEMRANERFERYVATTDVSGKFSVSYFDHRTRDEGETVAELKVCKLCLTHLNYAGYKRTTSTQKSEIWNNFSIEDFFETYKSHFKNKPTYTDKTAPKGGYADNWSDISNQFRVSVSWKCQKCGVVLSGDGKKSLLHVHHVNGVKGDNNSKNLKALCVLCHGEQPQHGHMHIKPKDKVAILALRREQKLTPRKSSTVPKDKPATRTSKKKHTHTPKSGPLSHKQARKELIILRSQIWKEMPGIEHSEGILRKNMMRLFLQDEISSKDEYSEKIPVHEREKTDPRQNQYFSQIFSITKRIK